MDPSEKRRKRKPQQQRLLPLRRHFRSLLLCFSLFTLLCIFSRRFPIHSSSFHPVLVLSTLPLSSSSSTDSNVKTEPKSKLLFSNFKVEDRVLFPDHVLLLVSTNSGGDGKGGILIGKEKEKQRIHGEFGLECVYRTNSSDDFRFVKRDVLSVDEYNEFRVLVRCPMPPLNCNGVVDLNRIGSTVLINSEAEGGGDENGGSSVSRLNWWGNLAYEAVLDGDTVVVFVKGLNHRPDRESDPAQFSCHFGLENWVEGKGGEKLDIGGTKAITAAQEVVRCLIPKSMEKDPSKALGIRVTIGVAPPHIRHGNRVLVPSVAKISSPRRMEEGIQMVRSGEKMKHELCVCTMVWNQASSLREWVTYHSWLGVEKWFIYDNNSDDEITEVIEKLDSEGYNVSRHVWPWIKTQEAGFSHCALRARGECNWVSFMDVDEFYYFPFPDHHRPRFRRLPRPGRNSLRNLVSNFSARHSTIGEIRTDCHSFGPSGLSSLPLQGVTVGYTCRLQSPERHKSIIRLDALDRTLLNVVHHFHLRKGFRYVNLRQSTAVINHYKYQVWDAFRAKFYRRVATYVADWQDNQNEGSRDRAPGLGTEAIEPPNWRLQFCEVWDTGLRDVVLANLADVSSGLLPWERSDGWSMNHR